MKKRVLAALLSGLILPGVGQVYQGKRLKGGILVLVVTVLLLVLVVLAALALQDVMGTAGASGNADPTALAESLRGRVPAILVLGVVFAGVWVYGVADALFGRDKAEPGNNGE